MNSVQSERSKVDRTCRFRRISGDGFRLALEVTQHCNLSCKHCFVSPKGKQPLTTELIPLIQQAAKLKCQKLIITGGEPLVRKDLEQIIKVAVGAGILVDLNSNLYGLTQKRAFELVNSGLQEVSVSLYSDREAHDRLTRQQGSFDSAINGIKVLKQAGVTVDVHGAIWDKMLPKITALVELVQNQGVSSLSFFSLLPTKTGAHQNDYKLTPDRALKTLNRIRESAGIPIRTVGLKAPEKEECSMSTGVYSIDADLKLTPCLLSRHPDGGIDLHQRKLEDALNRINTQTATGEWKIACCSMEEENHNG